MYTDVAARTPGHMQDETKAQNPTKGEKDDDNTDANNQEDQ
jgi:hypothetical protein